MNDAGQKIFKSVGLFSTGSEPGLMNFAFSGSAVSVIMFMLVIGGAFGVVMRTGTIDNGILRLIEKTKGSEALFIPVLFFLFSLGGAVFGMGEKAVAFAIIIVPLMVRLGYDGITPTIRTGSLTNIPKCLRTGRIVISVWVILAKLTTMTESLFGSV